MTKSAAGCVASFEPAQNSSFGGTVVVGIEWHSVEDVLAKARAVLSFQLPECGFRSSKHYC